MDARVFAVAIPIFLVFLGIEIRLARLHLRRQKERLYRLHDSAASLSCGIGQQVLGALAPTLPFAAYTALFERARVATIPPSPLAWIAILLAVDLGYWAYHVASHRVNVLWAIHAVHHQSEEYNLTTALRQSWLTTLTTWPFYLPLAVLGFDPKMYMTAYSINTVYQFWLHTRAVGKLGPLEALLVTPSHHRVHHGVDPMYIDRNYGGVLIVWDRLFGTFQQEVSEPVYGVVKPLATWNPFRANFDPLLHVSRMSRATRRLRDKLRVWIAPPDWRPSDLGGPVIVPEVSRAEQRKYGTRTPRILRAYVLCGLVSVGAVAGAVPFLVVRLAPGESAAVAALVLASLAVWSGLAERRPWAVPLEWAKLAGAVGLAAWLLRDRPERALGVSAAAAAAALGLALWVARCDRAAWSGVPDREARKRGAR